MANRKQTTNTCFGNISQKIIIWVLIKLTDETKYESCPRTRLLSVQHSGREPFTSEKTNIDSITIPYYSQSTEVNEKLMIIIILMLYLQKWDLSADQSNQLR